MADRNTQVGVLLAKLEVTEGTDIVPAAADAIDIVDPIANADGDYAMKTPRPKLVVGAAIQASPPLQPKGAQGTWSSTIHLRGPGAAYAAGVLPKADVFMQTAGLSQTLITTPGSEKVTYKPAATGLKSHTEYYYTDGRLKKMLACKSDVEIGFSSGGPVVATIKRTGLFQIPTDAAVIASPVYGTSTAPVVDSVGLNINGFTAGIIRKFKCSLGNHIAHRPSANAVGGLAPHKIRTRAPRFEVVLEDELAAAIDFETLRANRTVITTFTWFVNAAQYNRIRFTAGSVVIEEVKYSDDNGTQIVTVGGGCYDSTFGANDAVQIAFE